MRVEDLTLKNLKKENDYLLEIIKSKLKKKDFETEEERTKFICEEEGKAKKVMNTKVIYIKKKK